MSTTPGLPAFSALSESPGPCDDVSIAKQRLVELRQAGELDRGAKLVRQHPLVTVAGAFLLGTVVIKTGVLSAVVRIAATAGARAALRRCLGYHSRP